MDSTAPETIDTTPAPAPAEEPREKTLADIFADDSDDDTDDAAFLDDDESELPFEKPKEPEKPAEPTAAAAEAPKAEEPKTEPPAPVEPRKAAEPAPTPEPPKPAATPQPQLSRAEFEKQAVDALAQDFKLSDEEIELFTTEPDKVLPKLGAQVMVRSVQMSVDAIRNILPRIIEQHTAQQLENQRLENVFYDTWPALKGREDATSLIAQHATMFRQVAPQASADEVIKHVGASVMVALGLHNQPTQPVPAATGNGDAQVVRREPLPPHRPAAASSQRDLASSQASDNIFTRMAFEDD